MNDQEIYKKAAKKVKAKKSFFYHLITYVLVLAMLYAILYFENASILPVIIVGLSWGIAVAIHYFAAFGTEHLDFLGVNANWEEEELQKEYQKLEREKMLKERAEEDLLDEAERLELKQIQKRPLDDDFV